MEKYLIIITIFLSLSMMFFVNKRFTKCSPAFLFSSMWIIQILVMVIGWGNILLFNYSGLLYILLCLCFFNFGCTLNFGKIKRRNSIAVVNLKILVKCFCAFLTISVIDASILFFQKGLSFSSFLDINSIAEVANEMSIERYSGQSSEGLIERFLGINNYITIILGGYLFCLLPVKQKFISVSSIFPMVLKGLVHGAKMGTITGFLFWFIGFMISCNTFDYKIKIKVKHILKISIVILIFITLMLVNMMLRIGRVDLETFQIATEKMISYSLGHLPAFDIWFEKADVNFLDLTLGGKTFYGITNTLGILERTAGVFTEFCQISTTGSYTNVYTVFRIFIEDFGKIGTPIFVMFMGYLTTHIYNNFIQKKNLVVNTSLYFMICFFIGWSFVMSIFAYATYIIIPFVIYAVLKISGLRVLEK